MPYFRNVDIVYSLRVVLARPLPCNCTPRPTSAIFTFFEFVAPVIRSLAGLVAEPRGQVQAKLAVDTISERGRLEYLLVGLVQGDSGHLAAYPMGKGSGSVRGGGVQDSKRPRHGTDSGYMARTPPHPEGT